LRCIQLLCIPVAGAADVSEPEYPRTTRSTLCPAPSGQETRKSEVKL
jgi:hypothetical protein